MKKLLLLIVMIAAVPGFLKSQPERPALSETKDIEFVTASTGDDISPLVFVVPLSIAFMLYTMLDAKPIDKDEDEF